MSGSYSIIEKKLKQFQKRYSLDYLFKGLIIFILSIVIPLVLLLFFESILYISASIKRVLVISFLIFSLFVFVYWVIIPLLRFLNIFRSIDFKTSNKLIVDHFPEIKDQLLNIIELNEAARIDDYSKELLIASIDQKIGSIKHFNFDDAVILKKRLKRFALIFLLFLLFILTIFLVPGISKGPATRLVYFNKSFFKPSPYSYIILNDSLNVPKGDDFSLAVRVSSKEIMDDLYINISGNLYRMNRDSNFCFSYNFKNLNQSIDFNFVMNQYHSDNYSIKVLPKPVLYNFKVFISKPSYTQLSSETFENLTDYIVPVGSIVSVDFSTYDTDCIYIKNNELSDSIKITDQGKGKFKHSFKVSNQQQVLFTLSNSRFVLSDILKLNFKVINDEYPTISINSVVDSLMSTRFFFRGTINDDYGFSNLSFKMKIDGKIDSLISLPFDRNVLLQQFFYAFDFSSFKDKASSIEYSFEVSDNDIINGNKVSSSQVMVFKFPDFKEILQSQNDSYKDLSKTIKSGITLASELQDELNSLKQKLIDSNLTNWEKEEALKSIVDKRNQLENLINQAQKQNEGLDNFMNSFTDQNKEILDKQQQIQDLLQNLLSDELKKQLDEFNKMLEQFNQDKFNNLNKDVNFSLDDLSKQLDNSLEMLKKIQLESRLDQIVDELSKISEKQNSDIERIENKDYENLKESQVDLQNRMKDLKSEYQKIKEENSSMEESLNLLDFQKEFDEINNEFEKTKNELEKNKSNSSKQSMKQNKNNLDNLQFMLNNMMEENFSEQRGENIEDLQQILDNLVTFSFNQEKVLIPSSSQFFQPNTLVIQKKLSDDFIVIRDSLYALQLREPSIGTVVNKEIVSIESNFSRIEEEYTENRPYSVSRLQQLIMTSSNNLALFVQEVIDQLQKQEANSSSSGNKNCNKPGGKNSKPGFDSMKQMQQSLQQQLEQMMKMMKDGQKSNMNGELGKALSQQEMMQKMVREMMNSGSVGSDAQSTLKAVDQMLNNLHNDILRNNISSESLKRQQQIMTRLLEAERAENERDKEEKRESSTAKEQYINDSPKYFENTRSNDTFEERLLKDKMLLQRFYQQKYQQYIFKLDSLSID